ncbi:MAG: hypothetical protein ACI9Y7_001481 [Dokdonia sp.]|jgi:hypothetical protein
MLNTLFPDPKGWRILMDVMSTEFLLPLGLGRQRNKNSSVRSSAVENPKIP